MTGFASDELIHHLGGLHAQRARDPITAFVIGLHLVSSQVLCGRVVSHARQKLAIIGDEQCLEPFIAFICTFKVTITSDCMQLRLPNGFQTSMNSLLRWSCSIFVSDFTLYLVCQIANSSLFSKASQA